MLDKFSITVKARSDHPGIAGTRTVWLWLTLAFYVLAKVLEIWDARIYELSGTLLSGHTLKHFAAAAGALTLVLKVYWARAGSTSRAG
jgi:hypothetical protein